MDILLKQQELQKNHIMCNMRKQSFYHSSREEGYPVKYFLIFLRKLTLWHSLETLIKVPQHMLPWRNKKITILFGCPKKKHFLWSYISSICWIHDPDHPVYLQSDPFIKWTASREKGPLNMEKCAFTLSCTCARSHLGLCSPLIFISIQ